MTTTWQCHPTGRMRKTRKMMKEEPYEGTGQVEEMGGSGLGKPDGGSDYGDSNLVVNWMKRLKCKKHISAH